MEINESDISLRDVAPNLLRIPKESLPENDKILKGMVIAETIRLAFDSIIKKGEEEPWPSLHILSLRSWVTRKLQALIPEIKELYYEILEDLIRIGDVINLSKGRYICAPTRVIPIIEKTWLLISGIPTHYFIDAGYKVRISHLARHVIGDEGNDPVNLFNYKQERENYVGILGATEFSWEYLKSILEGCEKSDWKKTIVKGFARYKYNRGNDFHFKWVDNRSDRNPIATPLGLAGFWKFKEDYSTTRYYVALRSENEMFNVPRKMYKHICLLFDSEKGRKRSVIIKRKEENAILEVPFWPPEAQFRWLYSIGAEFLGTNGGRRAQWKIHLDTVDSTIEVFKNLPVEVELKS